MPGQYPWILHPFFGKQRRKHSALLDPAVGAWYSGKVKLWRQYLGVRDEQH